ncbi:MAG: hypothetical protein LBP76_14965, partial [Treponema sp.]|nr:hypothetical protein [Treponema sp.]
IRQAVDTLYELSANEEVRAQYEQRQKAWRDRISMLEGSYLDGERKGRIEGKLEGRIEGKLEGKIEGRLEGKIEGKLDAAKKALQEGLPIDLIGRITGLDEQTIRRL